MNWQSDHKFKCEQMRLLDPVHKLPYGVEANSNNNEKLKQMNNDGSPPKKRSNESNTEQVNDEDDEDGRNPTPSSMVPPKRRSLGRKAEKKLKKGGDGVVFNSAAQGMIVVKKEMEVERKQEKEARWMDVNAMEDRKLAIEENKLRLLGEEVCVKRMEQEYKIMFMDISGLGETQREYVELMRAKILASRRRAGVIGSV